MDSDVLEAAVRRNHRQRELEREEVLRRLDSALGSLAARYDLQEVYTFGSVLRAGRFCDESDVDVAVASLGPRYWSFAAELSAAIGREVDVVDLDASRLSPRIREEGTRWMPPR